MDININQKDLIRDMENYYVKKVLPEIFPLEDFSELINAGECYYCGITERQIDALAAKRKLRKKNLRGWHLEIDRLDSNLEYTRGNCVMCCYWCNNAKTDEFTPEEFRAVGQAIREIWSNRLSRIERYGSDGSEMKLIDL